MERYAFKNWSISRRQCALTDSILSNFVQCLEGTAGLGPATKYEKGNNRLRKGKQKQFGSEGAKIFADSILGSRWRAGLGSLRTRSPPLGQPRASEHPDPQKEPLNWTKPDPRGTAGPDTGSSKDGLRLRMPETWRVPDSP